MTETQLLKLILAMPGAEQSSHMGTTDFRAGGRIFCTHPKPGQLNLKLTPDQQQMLVESEPEMFSPIRNKWGQQGWTQAAIAALDETTARSALQMAWTNVTAKPAGRKR